MRYSAFVALPLLVLSLHAQDATQQIMMMQQTQMATQATQQAMQASQDANQQAMQAAQQAQTGSCCGAMATKPRLSLKPGAYPSGTILRMKDPTRGAVMYYTTDGWTPTTNSIRYVGPIKLTSNMTLQVVAVAPGAWRSPVVQVAYSVAGQTPQAIADTNANLAPGTPLRLTFTAAVNSKDLQIGDKLPVALDEDLFANGAVAAPKLTPVLATVTQVDHAGRLGLPGTLTFEVHSLSLTNGEIVSLSGTETMEGRARTKRASNLGVIPLAGVFVRGGEAIIPQGATLTARVNESASLRAAQTDPMLK